MKAEQDRAQVGDLAQAVQDVTGKSVEIAFVDQGYTREAPAQAAQARCIRLEVVKRAFAKRGFIPAFALMGRGAFVRLGRARIARLARDYERLPAMVAGLHLVAFAALLLHQFISSSFSGL